MRWCLCARGNLRQHPRTLQERAVGRTASYAWQRLGLGQHCCRLRVWGLAWSSVSHMSEQTCGSISTHLVIESAQKTELITERLESFCRLAKTNLPSFSAREASSIYQARAWCEAHSVGSVQGTETTWSCLAYLLSHRFQDWQGESDSGSAPEESSTIDFCPWSHCHFFMNISLLITNRTTSCMRNPFSRSFSTAFCSRNTSSL